MPLHSAARRCVSLINAVDQRAYSMDDLLESASCEHEGPVYMSLLPRGKDAIYTSISHKVGMFLTTHELKRELHT